MSTKNFLKPKKMQTGGMLDLSPKSLNTGASFVSPYVEGLNPRTSNPPSYGIPVTPPAPAPPPPPTITLDNSQIYDPGSFESTLSIHDPGVIAGAAALGHTLTGAENQFTLSDFKANAPPTALSTFFDAAGLFAGKAILTAATGGMAALPLAFVNKATTGSVLGVGKGELADKGRAAATEVFTNVGRALGMSEQPAAAQPATGIVAAAQSAAPAEVATSATGNITSPVGMGGRGQFATQTFAADLNQEFGPVAKGMNTGFGSTPTPAVPIAAPATTPASARQAIAAINRTPATAAPAAAPTAAAVGTGMFGAAYGLGGEISPSFAIGGKGSFTSFSHYGAGISQADEISITQSGMANNSNGFESPEASSATIDAMVSDGYNESAVVAVATGMGTEGKPDFDAGFSDPGGKVICQELYDQGLLEHSIYSLDEQFGEHLRKHDADLLEGYHTWAYSVVNAMRKSKTITHIVRIVSRPVVKHIAYKMGYPSKTLLGAAMFNVGAFVCRRLAKKETVYA